MPPAVDPFESLEKRGYRADKLIYGSRNRGQDGDPPLACEQDEEQKIRVSHICPRFQAKTDIQVGYELLHLQGKDVVEYKGGFQEISKLLQESLSVKVVVLKS